MIVPDTDPRELFRRHPGNPLITAADLPRMVNAVFNAAATEFDGETLLLMRVEDRTGLSHLAVATSRNGRDGWRIDRERVMRPQVDCYEEHWGIEDPRITRVGDEYYIVYTGFSMGGPLVCLATTRDFADVRASRRPRVAGGQGRRAVPGAVRRPVGAPPSAVTGDGRPRGTHLAVVESRPASLG